MTRALVPSTTSRHCATIVAIVTRNGHAAAVLNSSEDLASLEETIDVLSDDAYRPLSPS